MPLVSRFLTAVDSDALTLKVEFWEGLAFIHAVFKRKVAGMREGRRFFPQLKHWLKEVGHDHCYVAIDPADDHLHRFEQHFGFRDICVFNGARIMAQECK